LQTELVFVVSNPGENNLPGTRFIQLPTLAADGVQSILFKFCPAKAGQPESLEADPVRRSDNNPNSGCAAT
jgi:hypothetical protein